MTTESLIDAPLEGIFDIKRDVSNSSMLEKDDYHPVQPTTGNSQLNGTSTIVLEHNNNQNPFGLFNSFLKISGKFTKADGITDIAAADLELEHNWGFSLFVAAKLEVNGTEVENVEDVRSATALLGHCLNSSDYCERYGEMEGWIPDKGGKTAAATNLGWTQRNTTYGSTFELNLPLERIFGFCDVKKILYLANVRLTLKRNSSNELIFFNNAAPVAADQGKVILDDIKWMIKIYTPKPFLRTKLINNLMNDGFAPWPFMKRRTFTYTIPAGASFDQPITTTAAHPRYVLIGLKEATANTPDYASNNSLFDSAGVTSLRVNLNGNKYPDPAMTVDFTAKKVSEGYLAYVNFCLKYGVEPPLSLYEWTNFYTIFVFDTSHLAEVMLNSSIQVQIEIKRTSAAPIATLYCLLLEDELNKGFKIGGGKFLEYR